MIEEFLESFNIFPHWMIHGIIDSISTIPFLFLVFLIIELFEHHWAGKIRSFLKYSKKEGPFIGAISASIPQCGFSVVASSLYCEGFITKGTIIAVFLATSDEAIPVLLMYPEYISYILPLILIKLIVAIPVGYLIDCFIKNKQSEIKIEQIEKNEEEHIEGCCSHNITCHKKRDYLIHPLKHTVNIFIFILLVTLILNYLIDVVDITNVFNSANNHFSYILTLFLAPFVTAVLGLIPNCAISVGLVIMFIKGTITFGAMMSGLMSGAGIGLLVLLKNNHNKKDTFLIMASLVLIGYITGLLIQTFFRF